MKNTHKVKLSTTILDQPGFRTGDWVKAVPADNLSYEGAYWLMEGCSKDGTPWKDHPVGKLLMPEDYSEVKLIGGT